MRSNLIDFYRAIEATSQKMLESAKNCDWDAVARLESNCSILIKELRAQADSADLSKEQKKEKHQIMLKILRNDAQLRVLAEPWIGRMNALMQPHQSQALH